MRILEIIASADPASGGPIEGLLQLDSVGRRQGVQRDVVTCDPPDAPFLRGISLQVIALGKADTSRLLRRVSYARQLVPWLRANAREYDVIIVNGLWNYASLAASLVLPKGGTPYFVFVHGMLDPWFKRVAPLKHFFKQMSWLLFEGRLLANSRAALFTTEAERIAATGTFFGWSYRERVVGYGTAAPPPLTAADAEAFALAVPGLQARRYLLFLGRLHPKKGCDLLLRAFAQIASKAPEIDLVIAGPDEVGIQAELCKLAKQLGIGQRVHWPGALYGPAKWAAMRGADAFALTSHQENFGVAVAEALACEVPVLLSDKVNIWSEVDAAGAGLVGTDDLVGATDLLERWTLLPSGEVTKMQRAAARLFLENFEISAASETLVSALRAGDE